MGLELCPENTERFIARDTEGRHYTIRVWSTDPAGRVYARYQKGPLVIDGEASYRTENEWVAAAEVAAQIARAQRTCIVEIVRRPQ